MTAQWQADLISQARPRWWPEPPARLVYQRYNAAQTGKTDSRPVLEKSSIPKITTDALIPRYEALLLDAYGVLVHEGGHYPGAVELIQRLNSSKKTYYLLTNDASRSPSNTAGTRGSGWLLTRTELLRPACSSRNTSPSTALPEPNALCWARRTAPNTWRTPAE